MKLSEIGLPLEREDYVRSACGVFGAASLCVVDETFDEMMLRKINNKKRSGKNGT